MKAKDVINLSEANYEYKDALSSAPDSVRKEIENFLALPEDEKKNQPLLYHILGTGTPPYKMDPVDAQYTDEASDPKTICANCEFAYQKVATGEYICSQIRGKIQPEGWCRLWKGANLDDND